MLGGVFARADDRLLFLPVAKQSAQARIDLALDSANDEIRVSVYEGFEDEASLMQLAVLREAARRGKKVRLLIDGVGGRALPYAMLRSLERDGVQVKIFHPLPWGSLNPADYINVHHLMRRSHDKLYIASPAGDPGRGEMIIGSRNFGDEYFGLGPHAQLDVDAYYRGLEVKRAAAYFDKVWGSPSAGTPHLMQAQRPADVRAATSLLDRGWRALNEHQELALAGDGKWRERAMPVDGVVFSHGRGRPVQQNIRDLVALFDRARESIVLVSPYVIPTGAMWSALQRAIARGVKVKLYTNSSVSSDSPAQKGYEQLLPEIAKMGIEVWEYQLPGRKLHAKTFVVDEVETYLGSSNLDRRSLNLQTESGLVVKDANFARGVADFFGRQVPFSLAARDGVMVRPPVNCGGAFRRLLYRVFRNQL